MVMGTRKDRPRADEPRPDVPRSALGPATTTVPPLDDAVKPESVWRDDRMCIVFPDGREFPTDIRRSAPTQAQGQRGARTVKVGRQSLWGDLRWTFFPCDAAAAAGAAGSYVTGVVSAKYNAAVFELTCGMEDGCPAYATGADADDADDDDEYYDDDKPDRAALVLTDGLRVGRGIKCHVREDRHAGRVVAVVYVPSDRECVVHSWVLTSSSSHRRWRWANAGSARLVLPADFVGSVLDAVDVVGDTAVVRQNGRRNLRFEMDAPLVVQEGEGIRWSYGDAAWAVASPGEDVTSLSCRLDKTVNILCLPSDMPQLAAEWRAAGLAAARSACGRSGMCPVYIEARRDSSSQGLSSLIDAVEADSVMLILNVTESPDQAWLGADAMCEGMRDFLRAVRDVASRLPENAFRCVIIAGPQVADKAHDILEDYHTIQVLGPYTEMPDAVVVRCLMPSSLPDALIEPYRVVKEHCLRGWEESFEDMDPAESGIPFLLPVVQTQRLLQSAVEVGREDPGGMLRRVTSELSKLGAGPGEVSAETRRRLTELPLLLRESGGEMMYGQDEPIWATQRHLQAHLLRGASSKPTFIFYVGVNGLGKTTLAINSIRALGGALEEINCSSLDNTYAYGERAGFAVLNRKISALRASPSPLRALLLDEVDKNLDMLKALIKLADSDASAQRGLLDHPLAGIFVFITLNVVPDCDEHRKFAEEEDPQTRMERLRDLIVASVKNIGDTKVVHAIVSRLIPYIVVFNELNADGDRGKRHLLSLVEDEVRGFAREYGVRVVLDDDATEGLIRRSAAYGVGGFRSVRTFMRREIESAVGDMQARGHLEQDAPVVLRDAGTHLSGSSAKEGDTVLYAIAVTRYKRIMASAKASVGRMLDAVRARGDDRDEIEHDQRATTAAALGHLAAKALFSIDGGAVKFVDGDAGFAARHDDMDTERRLKASLAEMRQKVLHHSREFLDGSNQPAVDAAMQEILMEAGRFFRLSLPDNMVPPAAAPRWAASAWASHIGAEKKTQSKADAVREVFRELSGEWARLVEEQEDSMSDVRKFPDLRARAAKRAAEVAYSWAERAERLGLEESTLGSVNEMVIDGEKDEDAVIKEFELDAGKYEPPPMSVHLVAGVAKAFLFDWLVRDMLRGDYVVADRKQSEERWA